MLLVPGPTAGLRHRRVAAFGAPLAMVTTTAVSVVTLAAGNALRRSADPGVVFERGHPLVVLVLVGGLTTAVAGCWLLLPQHPAAGLPMSVSVATVLSGWWAGWPWLAPWVRAAALALPLAAAPCLAATVWLWGGSTHRGGRASRVVLMLSALAGAAAAGLHLLAYDPLADLACLRTCRAVGILVGPGPARVLLIGSQWLGVGAAALAFGVVAAAPSVIPGALRGTVATSVATLGLCRIGWSPTVSAPGIEIPLDLVSTAAVLLAASAAGASVVPVLLRRRAADRMVRQLEDAFTTARAGQAAHRLVPARWRQGAHGFPGALVQASWLTPVQRLSLANSLLSAQAQERLTAARSAQAHAVDLADSERARIERDLHDGAQQQLVTAALHLAAASAHLPADVAAEVTAARERIPGILAALRGISHGLFPPVLEHEGLAAALEELAADNLGRLRRLGEPNQLTAIGIGIARATYAVVSELLETSPAARVTVHPGPDAVRVTTDLARTGQVPSVNGDTRAAVQPAAASSAPGGHRAEVMSRSTLDRVEALGGTVETVTGDEGPRVEVTIPCGS